MKGAFGLPHQNGVPLTSSAARWPDRCAVFLNEARLLRLRQNLQHGLGRPAQLDAQRGDHDRPVDEDGVLHHAINELVIGQIGIVQA